MITVLLAKALKNKYEIFAFFELSAYDIIAKSYSLSSLSEIISIIFDSSSPSEYSIIILCNIVPSIGPRLPIINSGLDRSSDLLTIS